MAKKRRGNFRLGLNFEEKFIKDMVSRPEISIIELVSNAWDASATEVHITWPIIKGIVNGEIFEIKDNGNGMTENEFYDYWEELGVNKRDILGNTITLKDGTERPVHGRNGKGRLGLFAFSDTYTVTTCKDKFKNVIQVKKKGNNKYGDFTTLQTEPIKEGISGTRIRCALTNYVTIDDIKSVLSTRFGADPNFKIFVNNKELKLLDINQYKKDKFVFEGETIEIIQIPRTKYNQRLTQYQIVWWVNGKAVELNQWKDLKIPLSARNPIENKFVFNVVADFLEEYVKPEGTDFKKDSIKIKKIKEFVAEKIIELSDDFLKESQQTKKLDVIKRSKKDLANLNPIAQKDIGNFIEEAIKKTRIGADELSKLIPIIKTLDRSVHRFELLDKLATFTPDQMDKLNEILSKWSIEDIYTVLEELYWRLEVIAKLRILTEDPSVKEKEIHHLFDTSLWMFGPEYEGEMNFISNKSLKNVLSEILGVETQFEGDNKRPDIVATPNGSMWNIYGQKNVKNRIVLGYKRILIIELKRSGIKIDFDEIAQAAKYAHAINTHGKLQIDSKIICVVLGSTVDNSLKKPFTLGENVKAFPCTFETILGNAEARTLNLIDELNNVTGITDIGDNDITKIMQEEQAQTHL